MNNNAKARASSEWTAASRDIDRLINAMSLLPIEHPTYALLDNDLRAAVARRSAAGDRLSAIDRAAIERRKMEFKAVAV